MARRDEFNSKKLNKERTSKRGRKWGTSMKDEEEQPLFLSSTVDNTLAERITHRKGVYKRSVSPQTFVQGKRRRHDLQQSDKERSLSGASVDAQKMSLPGSYTVVCPMDDAQSRTVFVNNVHFAASKDSLSRHFNKFGEVLKVMILTDPASGKPKESVYIEFMRKESADLALPLNGTSFMSRILKVVQASSAPHEASSVPSWPRIVRGPAFVASRMARTPISRGITSSLRARLPVKQGARSLQWKQDAFAPSDTPVGTANIGNGFTSLGAQSLTYIRNEQTTTGNN